MPLNAQQQEVKARVAMMALRFGRLAFPTRPPPMPPRQPSPPHGTSIVHTADDMADATVDDEPAPEPDLEPAADAPAAAIASGSANGAQGSAFTIVTATNALAHAPPPSPRVILYAGERELDPRTASLAVSTPAAATAVGHVAPPEAEASLVLPMTITIVHRSIARSSCNAMLDIYTDAYLSVASLLPMTHYHCCQAAFSSTMATELGCGGRSRVRTYMNAHFCGTVSYDQQMPFSSIRLARGRSGDCQSEFHGRVCAHVAMVLANNDERLGQISAGLVQELKDRAAAPAAE